jgi:hypothetical protein
MVLSGLKGSEFLFKVSDVHFKELDVRFDKEALYGVRYCLHCGSPFVD